MKYFVGEGRPHTHTNTRMDLPTDTDERGVVGAFIAFMSTRGKGKGSLLSIEDVTALTGKPRLDLHEHDIYVMGRTKQNEPLWSKIRIESNTTAENKIQGKLGVRFLSGYGRSEAGTDELLVTFPEGIRLKTTQDSVGFKHRSAFYLRGKFYRLLHVEHLCNINVMPENLQRKYQSNMSIKKAQLYSMRRARKREWAHVSRDHAKKDQQKRILKMMIPYWTNCPDFYVTFLADVASACEEARQTLGPVEPAGAAAAPACGDAVDILRKRCVDEAIETPLTEETVVQKVKKVKESTTDLVVW